MSEHTPAWRALRTAIQRRNTKGFDRALKAWQALAPEAGWEQAVCMWIIGEGTPYQLKRILPLVEAASLPDALAACLSSKQWDMVPSLLEAGFCIPRPDARIRNPFLPIKSEEPWQQVVAHALGAGCWPHPELLCPRVLETRHHAQLAAEQGFYGLHGRGNMPGLSWFHLEKLTTLPWHADAPVLMGEAMGRAAHDINELFALDRFPHRQECLVHLMQAGLFSPEAALARASTGANGKKVVEWILDAQCAFLETATPTSPATRSRPRL